MTDGDFSGPRPATSIWEAPCPPNPRDDPGALLRARVAAIDLVEAATQQRTEQDVDDLIDLIETETEQHGSALVVALTLMSKELLLRVVREPDLVPAVAQQWRARAVRSES